MHTTAGWACRLMRYSMVLSDESGGKEGWWGVHSHKSRMIIYSPESGFYIYLVTPTACRLAAHCTDPRQNITLGSQNVGGSIHTSQGLPDHMVVESLQRGYEDFRVRVYLPCL